MSRYLLVLILLLISGCKSAQSTATAPKPAEPTAIVRIEPTATQAAPVSSPTVSSAAVPSPVASQPTPPGIDGSLAGQVRYISNTDGLGVKVRTTCDDQTGSGGWPEGSAVTVVYARADCPDWLLLKRSEEDGSWVRVAYLSEVPPAAAPIAAVNPTQPPAPTATTVPPSATSIAAPKQPPTSTTAPPPAAVAKPTPPTATPRPPTSTTASVPAPRPPGDKNCSDFPSQAAAQAALRADPSDPWGLDRDRDGIACENNRTPKDLVPVPRR
jgi:hypothetical protein